MSAPRTDHRPSRWGTLPRLLSKAPAPVVAGLGVVIVVLGLLVISRPLTSILLLGLFIGASAIVSGVVDVTASMRSGRWWTRISGIVWIITGLLIVVAIGRSLHLLPYVVAVLLLVGGVSSAIDAWRGTVLSERVLAAAWAAWQLTFGVLTLAWPDVTVLAVAVVFGVRTVVLGAGLLVRGVRGMIAARRARQALDSVDAGAVTDTSADPRATDRAATREHRLRAWTAAGRWALSVVLVGSAVGGWWLADYLEEGAPVIDAFYNPPDDVPTEHGRLIRSDEYRGSETKGGEARRILYTTRDAEGRRAVASALVISPTREFVGDRPVILWHHGTTGVAQGCAPSLQDRSATKWAIPALDEVLKRGWIVIASDYSGQGAPGDFPYLIGRGEARSSLDAVLAAAQLEDLDMSTRVASWGHSQGGHAALWSSMIADEYAPDLEIVGTAALAPAADPLALAEDLAGGNRSAELSILVSWVLVPYADTYAELNLSDHIAPGSEAIVREMTQRCPQEPAAMISVATALGVSVDRPLFVTNLATGSLARRLEQNEAAGPWTQPLLVAWGSADEVLPPRLQQDFVDSACGQGAPTRWAVYSGYTHQQILQPRSAFLPTLVRWTTERFRGGDGPVDDCVR